MGKKVKSIQNCVYSALNIKLLIFVLYVQGRKKLIGFAQSGRVLVTSLTILIMRQLSFRNFSDEQFRIDTFVWTCLFFLESKLLAN